MTRGRLGARQLALLRRLAGPFALIVHDKVSRSLRDRGLLADAGEDGFAHITPEGLRALAAAAEAGRVSLAPDLEALRAKPGADRAEP